MTRLPPPFGNALDRSQPLAFTFEGRRIVGFAGDTIASALLANGVRLIGRSFKYHRPRGVLSLDGGDGNLLVTADGAPNVPAESTPAHDGMVVRAQNYKGALDRDRWAGTARWRRFLPVGFYYWAFHRPAFLWPFWERLIRGRAGLGAITPDAATNAPSKRYAFADVAVIGAGPAGQAAARAARAAGARVILVGGNSDADTDLDGLAGARCVGVYPDNWLAVDQDGALIKLRANQVVLATGRLGQTAVFRNNDLPGVMLAGAARRLINRYAVCPGQRAVVFTTSDDGATLAAELTAAGMEIAALVDAREGEVVAEALGQRELTGVWITQADDTRRGRQVDCDLLVMATGSIPAGSLWCQAGSHMVYDPAWRSLILQDAPDGWHAAGSVRGAATEEEASADGAHAGASAAAAAGFGSAPGPAPPIAPQKAVDLPIVRHPKGFDFVDMDEDLTVHDLEDAVAQGFDHAQLLKRYSTLGMGPSQGKHALLAGALISARARNQDAATVGAMTFRPPAAGIRFDTLAGERFQPERLTPMHHRHLEAGAQMMSAGAWWRPAIYAAGANPDRQRVREIARAEACHVRRDVGLIDVSTLGKIEVRGPDAAAFMERLYTFRYAKQPVGRSRYLLMTDEAGYVIDDGVACRLSEEQFYVTTTTGASDQVYRSMLFWNTQWRLDVDVANVTGAYGAVNLAGPRSREVLAEVSDIDLSPDAFPYLAVREGQVAGTPARLFRVGFVGELGYEIHVPAGMGEALWDALMTAGADHHIAPFGVEAQRLLRLEKGHVIVGQDTDGLTHPAEAGMAWAVADKPYFVGDRAVAIHQGRQQDRSLIGFTLPAGSPMPEENHLVIHKGGIAGRVTSAGLSTEDDRIIGLAWVPPDLSGEGVIFEIRVDGRMMAATVASLPFYDPDNQRQAA